MNGWEQGGGQTGDTAGSIKVSTTCLQPCGSICHKVDLVLFKDGSGAGFKVGKVKLHFEVHGLAFSIISVLAINKHEPATLWLFSLDLLWFSGAEGSRLNSQSVALACWGQHDIIENAKPCTSKCNLTLPTLKPAPLPSFDNCVSGFGVSEK